MAMMDRDVRRSEHASEPTHDLDPSPHEQRDTTRFTNAGPIPPIAADGVPGPTASERGYGTDEQISSTLAQLVQGSSMQHVAMILANNPSLAPAIVGLVSRVHGVGFAQQAVAAASTPDRAAKTAPPAATANAAPPVDPARQKHIDRSMTAGWEQIARYTPDEHASPEHIRLPKNIVSELERAWKESFPGGHDQEQGGNLVKTYGGDYKIHRGQGHSEGMYEGSEDVGWTEDLVAQVHTHPYHDQRDKNPQEFATFSEGDFDSLMRSNAHMSVLRSGPYTFVLSKTKQFEQLVERSAPDNSEPQLQAIAKRMTAVYDKAFDASNGTFPEKCEAGVIAVAEQFHLVYYVGQGSDLTRKTHRPSS